MNLSAFRAASIAAVAILAMVLVAWQFGLLSPGVRSFSQNAPSREITDNFDVYTH